ncbi:FxSxx-COOH system tetratricopeptide repeat protein [Streptomyces ipomoeae]|uniref:FxSxx-COOH system tetratricopeptide repeat protein n=1 Tax=Streptomyces ipomoeae TaxID=103232 RepID=UPI0015F10A6B|nr:FxSxx-COOH system tetratricopeptide repeat protein [Streptomyces ipomoeae]MDX2935062.1 FxSxx-COOH system tetratricopeptide repeat protein [Streptomyces ipomoeae]
MNKRALIVANQHYRDGFGELPSTQVDARQLKGVLTDPRIGGFDVDIMENATAVECRTEIQRFFEEARADDLLLLHMSCHGRKDRRNRLHFVASDTDSQFLAATAISAEFISDLMEDSLSRRIVLLLDCCYSGAFSKGVRTRGASLKADLSAPFDGRAQVVITSSTALQYSYEGDIAGSRDQEQPSVFTAAVVEGLEDGAADLDQDGFVSTDDLYNFIHRRIKARVPEQTPTRIVNSIGEPLYLARNPSFSENGPKPAAEVDLVHVAEDRPWARWISGLLAEHDIAVHTYDLGSVVEPNTHIQREIDPLRWTVAVLSPAYFRSVAAQTLSNRLAGAGPTGGRWKLIPFRTEGVSLSAPYNHRTAVDARAGDAEAWGLSLLTSLGYPRETLRDVAPGNLPFPGRVPTHLSLPGRNPCFTGRTRMLEALYAHLVEGQPGTATLHGPAGVGKSQLALEYAHRFKWRYDLVWWIDADQADGEVLSLSQLAQRLGVTGSGTVEAARTAGDGLREGSPTPNWLLILDQGDKASDVWQHLGNITGPGHLIVTARSPSRSEPNSGTFLMDTFDHVEATTHLMQGVHELQTEQAELVARELHGHPMAVDIAMAHLAASRETASAFVGQLRNARAAAVAADNTSGDRLAPVRAVCAPVMTRLREQFPPAARLLELTAFLAPNPIAPWLLLSRQMSQAITPSGEEPSRGFTVHRALDAIFRHRLMENHGAHLSVHRLIQTVIRDEMSQDQRTAAQRAVHAVLTLVHEYGGGPYDFSFLEDVWPHLLASSAFESDDHEVRELLIAGIRQVARGDPERAVELGRPLMERWESKERAEKSSTPHPTDDDQLLSLRFEMGKALRLQGAHAEAMAWDETTLARQRQVFGDYHPRTLLTAQSLAAGHRALGQFQEACGLMTDVHQRFLQIFGEAHEMSLDAAHDLATDLRLTGDHGAARKISLETWQQRSALFGPSAPNTLTSKSQLARSLRELGDYALSVALLREIVTDLGDLTQNDAQECLRQRKSLAVALRWAGHLEEAHALTVRALADYEYLRLTEDADAVACRANLAADEAAADRPDAARDIAAEALAGFQRLYGPTHPFTLACRSNLGVHLRRSGDLAEAMIEGEQAVEGLGDTLGARHPYTLTALASLANTAAEEGHLARAQEWGRAARLGVRDCRGIGHPDTYAYALDLAITLRAAGQVEESEHLRNEALDGLSSVCGRHHPRTAAARVWQRIDGDLEPA